MALEQYLNESVLAGDEQKVEEGGGGTARPQKLKEAEYVINTFHTNLR